MRSVAADGLPVLRLIAAYVAASHYFGNYLCEFVSGDAERTGYLSLTLYRKQLFVFE